MFMQACKQMFRELETGDFTGREHARGLGHAHLVQRLHSITFGTRNRPASTAGALRRFSSRRSSSVTTSSRRRSARRARPKAGCRAARCRRYPPCSSAPRWRRSRSVARASRAISSAPSSRRARCAIACTSGSVSGMTKQSTKQVRAGRFSQGLRYYPALIPAPVSRARTGVPRDRRMRGRCVFRQPRPLESQAAVTPTPAPINRIVALQARQPAAVGGCSPTCSDPFVAISRRTWPSTSAPPTR